MAPAALPTLLTSRPIAQPVGHVEKERRPAPCATIEIPEETEVCPPGLRVRNTFLDTQAPLSPSLQPFYRERTVRTCPGAHAGILHGLFQEGAYAVDVPAPAMPGADGPTPLPSPAPYMPATPNDFVHAKTVVSLADMLDLPPAAPAMAPAVPAAAARQLPSAGSALHGGGECKPCAFLHTKGCENGLNCQFCHICDAGERKRRRQAKVEAQRVVRRERKSSAQDQ